MKILVIGVDAAARRVYILGMSDGREERDEMRKRVEQEKRADREDWQERGDPDEGAPERGGS